MEHQPVRFIETCMYCGEPVDRATAGAMHINVHRADQSVAEGVNVVTGVAHTRCFVASLPPGKRREFGDWPR